MSRFCLPRDIYHGKGSLEELKNLKGKKAILVVGGGSMKRQGFLDKAVNYLKEAGMEVQTFEGVEPDPSVETVMRGAEAMRAFEPELDRCHGRRLTYRRCQGNVGFLRVSGYNLRGSVHPL